MKRALLWRVIAIVLSAVLLLSLTACKKEEDQAEPKEEQSQTSEPKQEESPAAEPEEEPEDEPEDEPDPGVPADQEEPVDPEDWVLDGTYRRKETGSDGEITYVQVRTFPDFVLLEYFDVYEGSTYSFVAEEFQTETESLSSEGLVLQGKSQEFSLMTRGNEYVEMPRARTITLNQDGLSLQFADGTSDLFERDESGFSGHSDKDTMLEVLNSMCDTEIPDQLVGCWSFWDGWQECWIRLDADGGLLLCAKEPGCPVHILEGVWGVDQQTGQLRIFGEMAGEGLYPYNLTWNWSLEDALLTLQEEEPLLLPDYEYGCSFWTAEDTFYRNTLPVYALGYVYAYYDTSGTYTDQYGTDYTYNYRLPQFLEETGDLGEMNAEIMAYFGPTVEEEMAAMDQGEFLSADLVSWELFVHDGILTLHVFRLGWEWDNHYAWYYDLELGKRIDGAELLQLLGIPEDEFLTKVRAAAENCFVEAFGQLSEEDRQANGYYEMLEWTVSDAAVNLDLPIVVDEFGNICVYGRIGSLAGASEMWMPLYPFAEWAAAEG